MMDPNHAARLFGDPPGTYRPLTRIMPRGRAFLACDCDGSRCAFLGYAAAKSATIKCSGMRNAQACLQRPQSGFGQTAGSGPERARRRKMFRRDAHRKVFASTSCGGARHRRTFARPMVTGFASDLRLNHGFAALGAAGQSRFCTRSLSSAYTTYRGRLGRRTETRIRVSRDQWCKGSTRRTAGRAAMRLQ
jgi:hypothetical protein